MFGFNFASKAIWISVFKLALLAGVSERVADIKTRAHAMRCLTTFCESVGPGFIFERVSIVVCIICGNWSIGVSLTVRFIWQTLSCIFRLCCFFKICFFV